MGRTYECYVQNASFLTHAFLRGGDDLGSDTMAARFALLNRVGGLLR